MRGFARSSGAPPTRISSESSAGLRAHPGDTNTLASAGNYHATCCCTSPIARSIRKSGSIAPVAGISQRQSDRRSVARPGTTSWRTRSRALTFERSDQAVPADATPRVESIAPHRHGEKARGSCPGSAPPEPTASETCWTGQPASAKRTHPHIAPLIIGRPSAVR